MTGMRWSPNIGRHAAGTSALAVLLLLCSLGVGSWPARGTPPCRRAGPGYRRLRAAGAGPAERSNTRSPWRARATALLVAAGAYEVRTAEDVFVSHQRRSRREGGFQSLRSFREAGAGCENQTTLVGATDRIPGSNCATGGFTWWSMRKGLRRRAARGARGLSRRLRRHERKQRPDCLQQW